MLYQRSGPSGQRWGYKSHPDVSSSAAEDGSILVVPVGSLEQHGHHMPTITDSLLAEAVANEGADRVNGEVPVQVTPPVWTGHSTHHLGIGATISLEFDTMLNVLEDVADSALQNGFDALLFLNGHGGNISLVSGATQTIGPDHPGTEVLGLTYWMLVASEMDEFRDSDIGGMSHGGELETSLLLYLRPDLVDEESIEVEYYDEPYDQARDDLLVPGDLSVYRPFDSYTETGVGGDPSLATPEKGEEIFDRIGDAIESLLLDIYERNS